MIINDTVLLDLVPHLTELAESLSYEKQDLGASGFARRERATCEDPETAHLLWGSLAEIVPEPPEGWRWVGCNPYLRFYRYGMGAAFSTHTDEPAWISPTLRTFTTVLVYLPVGGCEGGETIVEGETIQVVDGRVALFDHYDRHEGRPVERGQKLVMRSDLVASSLVHVQ